MITAFSALVLGVVEGFTEFLPISSTAHLILASSLLGIPQTNFTKTFEIAIQSGAILAVVFLYWRSFLNIEYLKKIIVAFIPTGIIGLILYSFVKTYLLGNVGVVLWSLALGGVVLIFFEYALNENSGSADLSEVSYQKALALGIFQSIAIIPGVSRSAATIVGGMLLGISRATIVEFSFLLAVPTMIAATGFDLLKNIGEFSLSEFDVLAIGFVVSFLTAFVGIRFLLGYIRKHNFVGFGIYRILLVVFFLLFTI